MTQNELKKLHRIELLELLIEQTKRADTLENEVAELKAKLASREIDIENAGTLAEAALKINEVLAAADAAAQQYLYNVKRITGNLPEEPKADEIETEQSIERIEESEGANGAGAEEAGEKKEKRPSREEKRAKRKERLDKIRNTIKKWTSKKKEKT